MSEGYDPGYDRDEYSRMAREEHKAGPVRWTAKGLIEVTVHPFDPRTGEDLPPAALWLPFDWTYLDVTPDDSREEVIESLRDNLNLDMKRAADRLLGIDLEICDIEDLYIIWEAEE